MTLVAINGTKVTMDKEKESTDKIIHNENRKVDEFGNRENENENKINLRNKLIG